MEVFLPLLPSSTGLPERSDQHSTRPLACPERHWVWPLADSQANLTEPEKPKPYSSVFPNIACARSDKLCEVTRSTARKGPLLYPPRFALAYGFCKMYTLPVVDWLIITMQQQKSRSAILVRMDTGRSNCASSNVTYTITWEDRVGELSMSQSDISVHKESLKHRYIMAKTCFYVCV